MRFLIIGLGSMGKRRIRCLSALGYRNVVGFDLRNDRRKEAEEKYQIKTYSDFEEAFNSSVPSAMIISVPPDIHHLYIHKAIQKKVNFFVEASVIDEDFSSVIASLKDADFVGCPSCTLCFHAGIKKIKNIVQENTLGKISNFHYHSGQYLPDWHTYEDVSDFYVSNPLTGGAREIVPFELTWITDIFGFPKTIVGQNKKTIEIPGAEKIDDTYNILMDFQDHLGLLTVDVVSRFAVRKLIINGSLGQLTWDWNDNALKIYLVKNNKWTTEKYNVGEAMSGYNKNIGEIMYIEEVRLFIESFEHKKPFPNNFLKDQKVLNLLYKTEQSYLDGKTMRL